VVDAAGRLDTDELARVLETLIVAGHTTAAGLRDGVHHELDSLPALGQEHRILADLVDALTA
jgi:cytochrome P450